MSKKKDDFEGGSAFGTSIARNFHRVRYTPYKTVEDFNYLLEQICTDKNVRKGWKRRLRAYYNGGVEVDGVVVTDPNDDEILMAEFDDEIGSEWGEYRKGLHPLTHASAAAWRPGSSYLPFTAHKEEWWLSWYAPGNDAFIIGDKGTGKTDMGELLADWLRQRGIAVVSAIPLLEGKTLTNYTECTLGSQLLRTLCHLKNQDRESVVLLDEGYLFTAGQTPLKPEVLAWTGLGRLLRKFLAAQVVISQDIHDIHSDVKREATLRIKKLRKDSKDQARIDMNGTFEGKSIGVKENYKWIPPTEIPFDTSAIATFKMDFDPDALYRHLAGMEKGKNQFRETLLWLDKRGIAFEMEQKIYLAKAMQDQGIVREKIAKVLGVSVGSVDRYLKISRDASLT
jgi:hypothetical protein